MAFTLDTAGGAEVLKVLAAEHIAALAQQISAAVGAEAVVETKTTDRARASVKVPAFMQAKDGVLSRAAVEAGLEFRAYEKRAPKKRAKADKTTDGTKTTARKRRRTTKKPTAK